jgi:hypothetical protein
LKPGAKREFAEGEASAVRAGPEEIYVSKFTGGKSHLPRTNNKTGNLPVLLFKKNIIDYNFLKL